MSAKNLIVNVFQRFTAIQNGCQTLVEVKTQNPVEAEKWVVAWDNLRPEELKKHPVVRHFFDQVKKGAKKWKHDQGSKICAV